MNGHVNNPSGGECRGIEGPIARLSDESLAQYPAGAFGCNRGSGDSARTLIDGKAELGRGGLCGLELRAEYTPEQAHLLEMPDLHAGWRLQPPTVDGFVHRALVLAEEMKELRLRSIVVAAAQLQGLGGESCAVALGGVVVAVGIGLIPAPRGGHNAVFQVP